MNGTRQATCFSLLLVLLAFLSWYFSPVSSQGKLDAKMLSTTPDLFVTDLVVHQFDENGLLVHELSSPFMQHIPQNDSHIFQDPFIQIHQLKEPSWEIHAKEAVAVNKGEHITFNKQVIVHQNADPKTEESTLTTEKMVYFPKKNQATTDLLVTFKQANHMVQARGMLAYLAEKRIQLLHQVRGHYVPKA